MGWGKKEAAVQLAQDFGLSYEDWKPPGKAKKPKPRQKPPEEQFQEAKNRCFRILADYLHLLRAWRKDYAPHSPEEAFHPRFVEALQKQAQSGISAGYIAVRGNRGKSGFDYGLRKGCDTA